MAFNSGSSDYSPGAIDRENIDRLRNRRSFADYQKWSDAAAAASERAADNQATRTNLAAKSAANLTNEMADRDLARNLQSKMLDAGVKSGMPDDKASDRATIATEGDKNRTQESFLQRAGLAAGNANANSNIESNEKIARLSQQTQMAESKAATERASIAAKAQISSAILGNNQQFGGYW